MSATTNGAVREPLLVMRNVHQRLGDRGSGNSFELKVPDLHIVRGAMTVVCGESGCGKTTLLQLGGLISEPTSQDSDAAVTLLVPGAEQGGEPVDVLSLWQSWRGRWVIEQLRRRFCGFCLQRGELLASQSVAENLALPLQLNGWSRQAIGERVDELLTALSGNGSEKLLTRRENLVGQLSGGEYQRVALARAVAHRPGLLLLDEPTASLDRPTAEVTLQHLSVWQQQGDLTVLLVTHDEQLARRAAAFMVKLDSFRPGHGSVASFERRLNGDRWVKTDSRWQIQGDQP